MTRLLVLGAGPAQLGVLAAARARDLTVVAADRDPSAPGFSYADRRAIVSIEDEPAIERLASALQVDGVIAPGSDWSVAVAARVAEKLDLPHPVAPATAVLATNKLRMRERLAAAGVVPGGPPVVSYCGSGVTACHNLLVMEHAGLGAGRLYPGSWSQWSADPERPVATG